jgi:hypothetical protein
METPKHVFFRENKSFFQVCIPMRHGSASAGSKPVRNHMYIDMGYGDERWLLQDQREAQIRGKRSYLQ